MNKQDRDYQMALKLAQWMAGCKGCEGSLVEELDTGTYTVKYAINGKVFPPVRIHDGKILFPKGTDSDLMEAFFDSL